MALLGKGMDPEDKKVNFCYNRSHVNVKVREAAPNKQIYDHVVTVKYANERQKIILNDQAL